jgi:hypothetical protein
MTETTLRPASHDLNVRVYCRFSTDQEMDEARDAVFAHLERADATQYAALLAWVQDPDTDLDPPELLNSAERAGISSLTHSWVRRDDTSSVLVEITAY